MSQSDLGLSCPRGGDFYICKDAKIEFVGCCTSDPCADGSGVCESNRLKAASFSSNKYHDIGQLGCDLSTPRLDSPEPLWYTCAYNNPPFMGCCYNNPCADGRCADANLSSATLPSETTPRQLFLEEVGLASGGSKKLSGGAIAGIVIGSVVGVLAIVAALWYLRRRKQQKKAIENTPQLSDGAHTADFKGSPNPNYSPYPSQISPHSGYGFPGTPPQGLGLQNGYQTVPTELDHHSGTYAELSGNHAGEVAMLDSTPIQHHQTQSPTIPLSETTAQGGAWPADRK